MAIPLQDARGLFTKQLVAVYRENIRPKSFLRSFFPDKKPLAKNVSIEVERGFELVAVDVQRGSEGNRNSFSTFTEKIFTPPFWREYMDITQLDLYDRVLGSQKSDNTDLFEALVNETAFHLGKLQDKIERAKELQCAQVITTGIVSVLNTNSTIDFRRKAASLVDLGGGNYFATTTVNPFAAFEAGCKFLRTVGKSGESVFNAIMGSQALNDMLSNPIFTARQNFFHMQLDGVTGPVRQSTGANLVGYITAGAYKVQIWTYPEFYDNQTTGVSTEYIDPKKVILMPANPKFVYANALVPQLIDFKGQTPKQDIYTLGEYLDERNTAHIFDVKAAGLPIPVAVDQIYTFKAVA